MEDLNSRKFNGKLWLLATVLLTVTVYFFSSSSLLYRTSVLNLPEHAPFDGTVNPVKKSPNWVHVNRDLTDQGYSALSSSDLVDLPTYDASELATSVDDLIWGNKEHDKIRNAKITYPVPYMSAYDFSGLENTGSHPAVDISIPNGTPIYAIMNGVVSKIGGGGFGTHIVLQHNNVPDPDNSKKKTTLHSSYSHLSTALVEVGDVVSKGQKIALSGDTGTATAPHLHFQLDTSDAPWHPYWPFTWQEAQDAGLSFFAAVNAGLGKEKALATTTHPMEYVQKYFDENSKSELPESDSGVDTNFSIAAPVADTDDSGDDEESETAEEEVVVVPEVEEEDEDEDEPEVVVVEEDLELQIVIETSPKYYVGSSGSYTVKLEDQFGRPYRDGLSSELILKSISGKATPDDAFLKRSEFNSSGELEGSFKKLREGSDRLEIRYAGEKYRSKRFKVEAKAEGAPVFSDLSESSPNYEAISYLVDEEIISGYPDGTFKENKVVSRVEALKFILEGTDALLKVGDLPYNDASRGEWYGKYLYTAMKSGLVDASNKYFRPGDAVNKAELYTMLFAAMELYVDDAVSEKPFNDVPVDAWYAPTMALAKEMGLTANVTNIQPAKGMTRGEVAYAIYKLLQGE